MRSELTDLNQNQNIRPNQGGQWARTLLLVVAVLCTSALASQPSRNPYVARGRIITMKWQTVAGAGSYHVEIQDSSNKVLISKRTPETSLSFEIPSVGNYRRRIAAVDRAGIRGEFSRWQIFRVKKTLKPNIKQVEPEKEPYQNGTHRVVIKGENFMRSSKVLLIESNDKQIKIPFEYISRNRIAVNLKMSVVKDGEYDILVRNPGKLEDRQKSALAVKKRKILVAESRKRQLAANLSEPDSSSSSEPDSDLGRFNKLWPAFVPGLPAMQRGDSTSGGVWAGAFGGTMIMAFLEYDAARIDAQNLKREPLYQVFNNPVLLYSLASNVTNPDDLLVWAVVSDLRHAQVEQSFNRHTRNQLFWSSAAAGIYLTHFFYESNDSLSYTHLVPGWTHIRMGRNQRGNAWIAALSIVAGGMVFNKSSMDKKQAALDQDFVGQITGNDVFFLSLMNDASSTGALGDFSTLALAAGYHSGSNYKSSVREIENQQKTQQSLSWVLGLLYFAQIMDAAAVYDAKGGIKTGSYSRSGSPLVGMVGIGASQSFNLESEQIHSVQWDINF